MAQMKSKLILRPEIPEKLEAGKEKLWLAVHGDGSDNRINEDRILEAASYSIGIGLLSAAAQGIRRRFRNRKKTPEDLAAEKEADRINKTSGALEEMLLEYFRPAQQGIVEEETLDELTEVLDEMHEYCRAGKIRIPGQRELTEMRRSIEQFTAALAAEKGVRTAEKTENPEADEFFRIREQLLQQKKLIG